MHFVPCFSNGRHIPWYNVPNFHSIRFWNEHFPEWNWMIKTSSIQKNRVTWNKKHSAQIHYITRTNTITLYLLHVHVLSKTELRDTEFHFPLVLLNAIVTFYSLASVKFEFELYIGIVPFSALQTFWPPLTTFPLKTKMKIRLSQSN